MARQDKNAAWQDDDVERVRSTPLRPTVWMTSVLVWATVVGLILRVPTWASLFLCGITGISFIVFMVCYIYLFASDREALRAERFRRRSGRTSSRVVAEQTRELAEDHQRYLESERSGLADSRPDAAEQKVKVEAGRATK